MVEHAAGAMDLDRFAPFVVVEPAGEGQPVGAGEGGVARAELLAIGEPEASLGVDADLRRALPRGALELWSQFAVGQLRRGDVEGRQLRGRLLQFAVLQADDAHGARAVERLAVRRVEGAIVLAPQL